MITEDYVSFETAKLLKYKGADFDTDKVYTSMGRSWEINMKRFKEQFDYDVSNYIQRPTLQMAMKWLREEKSIYIKIGFRFSCNADDDVNYFYDIYNHCEKYIVGKHYSDGEFVTYEEAAEVAIKYCLENLI